MDELIDLWRDIGNRLGFYTHRTKGRIPESAGIYAWFVPLWRYSDNPEVLLQELQRIFLYDPRHEEGKQIRKTTVDFNWDSTSVTVARSGQATLSEKWKRQWSLMMNDPEAKQVFERALMEATLLTAPLYVGKADNLRTRYEQHVNGSAGNDFNRRFQTFMESFPNLALSVSDLLFVSIEFEPEVNRRLRTFQLNELLENIMLRACRPPFSMR